MRRLFIAVLFLLSGTVGIAQTKTDVLIIGGGASGTIAAIQAARMGASVLVVEETTWLGGMLTSAGVSAIDGNHQLPSGLWGEFRDSLWAHYGGPDEVETGWVSNTLFEPAVGNAILKSMVQKEKSLDVWYEARYASARWKNAHWTAGIVRNGKIEDVEAAVLIDATELGDVMAALNVSYDIGMDSREETGERFAPAEANDIIQDMTYVVTLQDYGPGADKTIARPSGYNAEVFKGACDVSDPATFESGNNDCEQMIRYGKLPNGKYMINWPKRGNDIYLNIIEMSPSERTEALKEAKMHSLRFVYYLQTELGFKHLGIAENAYPTADGLPMIPYHRESRRVQGKVQLTLNHILEPYSQKQALYRTGITVGDYTIDHHHEKNLEAPEIDFVKIRVPSYNVPLGSLIPESQQGLIVAEKSISVSNIVNGATRLQPVVIGIGQASGALAALAVQQGRSPEAVPIRQVQQVLLEAGVYIMPFLDVNKAEPHFQAIQRIGACGILRGTGVPYKWANQTWFYPQRAVSEFELVDGLRPYYPALDNYWDASGKDLSLPFLLELLQRLGEPLNMQRIEQDWEDFQFAESFSSDKVLNRRQAAVLVDTYLKPFSHAVDFKGKMLNN